MYGRYINNRLNNFIANRMKCMIVGVRKQSDDKKITRDRFSRTGTLESRHFRPRHVPHYIIVRGGQSENLFYIDTATMAILH